MDNCGGIVQWLDSTTSYTAFTEGWGLYSENPLIGQDTDTYEGRPLAKYGMLKWQVGSLLFGFEILIKSLKGHNMSDI